MSSKAAPILLTSIDALNAHVATLPPTPDVDVWWECPLCGARNYGVLLGSYVPCPECRNYDHPPAGMSPKSRAEIQIEAIELEIVSLENEAAALQDEVDYLQREIDDKRVQVRRLKKAGRV